MKKRKVTKAEHRRRVFWRRWWFWSVIVAVVAVLVGCTVWYERECRARYEGDEVRIFLPDGVTAHAVSDTLTAKLGPDFGKRVMRIWRWRNGLTQNAEGSYVIKSGMSAIDVSRKLLSGIQDPVRVTFNNVRTMDQLAERVARRLELTPDDFTAACDSVLSELGFSKANYPAAFVPDTYEFYWNADPAYVVKRMVDVRNKFWTDKRMAQADALGLTPEQVATVASIVEEESAKPDERPVIARLYLNRLHKGMRLQADPTVKYATGDFALRRITGRHLAIESPYNTYLHEGLPPGPIRIVERQTLDDVLNAPQHNYIYMCAKEDFSGYHNFTASDAEHLANARRYHQAINKRGYPN